MELHIHATFSVTDQTTRILFYPQTLRRAECFQVRHIDHSSCESAFPRAKLALILTNTPMALYALPAVVKHLVQTVFLRYVASAQTVSITENDPAHHAAAIQARSRLAFQEKRLKTSNLFVRPSANTSHHLQSSHKTRNKFPTSIRWILSRKKSPL